MLTALQEELYVLEAVCKIQQTATTSKFKANLPRTKILFDLRMMIILFSSYFTNVYIYIPFCVPSFKNILIFHLH